VDRLIHSTLTPTPFSTTASIPHSVSSIPLIVAVSLMPVVSIRIDHQSNEPRTTWNPRPPPPLGHLLRRPKAVEPPTTVPTPMAARAPNGPIRRIITSECQPVMLALTLGGHPWPRDESCHIIMAIIVNHSGVRLLSWPMATCRRHRPPTTRLEAWSNTVVPVPTVPTLVSTMASFWGLVDIHT
jgi:hypothetical protein